MGCAEEYTGTSAERLYMKRKRVRTPARGSVASVSVSGFAPALLVCSLCVDSAAPTSISCAKTSASCTPPAPPCSCSCSLRAACEEEEEEETRAVRAVSESSSRWKSEVKPSRHVTCEAELYEAMANVFFRVALSLRRIINLIAVYVHMIMWCRVDAEVNVNVLFILFLYMYDDIASANAEVTRQQIIREC